ncbi:hypothetical protein [Candidatus Nitrotoga arctica]|uniref:hypothetical protein n=1 Tax=Candidatus Nitrotoga arctica TaxID=453162 RepID=UPI001EFBE0DC|nr:hypothetical protein [Candidatus Nitrotoga arctica]
MADIARPRHSRAGANPAMLFKMPLEKSLVTDSIGGFVFDFLRPFMCLGLYQLSLTLLIFTQPPIHCTTTG